MITFNDVLGSAGIDPSSVLLVRHQDTRARGPSIYETWKEPGGQAIIEEYQAIQGDRRVCNAFGASDFVASFVAPGKETLFIGLYGVHGHTTCPAGQRDPIIKADVSGFNFYEMELDNRLDECRGHLFVDWGPGTRQWWQYAVSKVSKVSKPKPVLAGPPAMLAMLADPVDEDDVEALGTEGRLLMLQHRVRERDAGLRRRKIEVARRDGRELACEACALSFEDTYGERGRGFIECHHVVPLHETGERTASLEDLALLCANCHRMIHRSPWLTPAELRDLITRLRAARDHER